MLEASVGLFPLLGCHQCGGERLGFVDLQDDGLVHVCCACQSPAPIVRWVDDSTLSALGFRVAAADPVEAPQPKKTGCSKGSCGTGGGCSTGGSCGTCAGCGSH